MPVPKTRWRSPARLRVQLALTGPSSILVCTQHWGLGNSGHFKTATRLHSSLATLPVEPFQFVLKLASGYRHT